MVFAKSSPSGMTGMEGMAPRILPPVPSRLPAPRELPGKMLPPKLRRRSDVGIDFVRSGSPALA